nr:unnamed protein product [Mus musculus]
MYTSKFFLKGGPETQLGLSLFFLTSCIRMCFAQVYARVSHACLEPSEATRGHQVTGTGVIGGWL